MAHRSHDSVIVELRDWLGLLYGPSSSIVSDDTRTFHTSPPSLTIADAPSPSATPAALRQIRRI